MICAICCGTEREVTIDCPSDCPYLIASRQHPEARRRIDWEKVPFPDKKVPESVLDAHEDLFLEMSYVILEFARDNPSLVDSDVLAALQVLAETYQTLASGVVYERPPDHRTQRELYEGLKRVVQQYKHDEGERIIATSSVHDSEMRDLLILVTQIAAAWSNGRPKGRAFIDSLRSRFKPGTFAKSVPSSLIVAP